MVRIPSVGARLSRPRLSVVVVVFDMPTQAMNTLRSLAPAYQGGVAAEDYEVIVVENSSPHMLDPQFLDTLEGNFRYIRRNESGSSPVPAIGVGVAAANGRYLAIMIDGARMLTPGVVRGLLDAQRLGRSTVAAVPGYHLGDALHSQAAATGYSAEEEQRWLGELDWREDGYRLFSRCVLSASCSNGFFMPMAESNCVSLSRRLYQRLGGYDPRFISSGGGFANLDFYRRAVLAAGSRLVVLPGEGAFHQFHGGASTAADHEAKVATMRAEYVRLRGRDYDPPEVAAVLLGTVPVQAAPFLKHSADVLARKVSP